MVLGWSLAVQGHVAEGVALAEQVMAASAAFGQRLHRSQFAAMLAEAYLLARRYAAANNVTDAGIPGFGRFRDPGVCRISARQQISFGEHRGKLAAVQPLAEGRASRHRLLRQRYPFRHMPLHSQAPTEHHPTRGPGVADSSFQC